MRKLIYIPLFILGLVSCTKEVQIDIPGYKEQLVVDGSIETGAPPIVFLSTTNNIYSPTNLQAYLEGFISGAVVTVSDGTTTVVLDEICTDNLPAGTEEIVAQLFGIPADQLVNLNLCAYTSFNTDIWGEVGKTYNLTIQHEGKTYSSSTQILQPTPLVNTFWKPDGDFTDRGFSWATLADPAGQYDAYRWEVKYLNDNFFTKTFSPFTDDEFFNGLTFEFSYENPMTCNGEYEPEEYRCYFKENDTVVIKISKCDRNTYEFMERKYTQIFSAGNPFASPTNIPSNIVGGALGLWAGYSPWYDTLICVE